MRMILYDFIVWYLQYSIMSYYSSKAFEKDGRNIFWNFLVAGDNLEIMDRFRKCSKTALAH